MTSDLGTCQNFVWELQRSNLIERGQLDQLVGDFLKRNPRAEPTTLAEFLVSQEVLTPFQAQRILEGKTQGLVLGPYVLMDAIGSGSMGQVYKALNKSDTQCPWYAVKVLPRRSMWNVRLARRQVRAFSQFVHPSVVPFVDVGTSGGLHYLVWPLVEGQPLDVMVATNGPLGVEQACGIAYQIAQGLNVCHQNGLFHGLLKPSNVMIGSDGVVRILDLGIGSLLVENEASESLIDTMSTATTLTSGLDCASPESISNAADRTPPGDQYSLGCVLYFMLTGRYPFQEGGAVEKMMAHQFKQPTPIRELNPQVPEEVAQIIDRLMKKKPEERYSGADEVAEALMPFAGEAVNLSANIRKPIGGRINEVLSGGGRVAATPIQQPAPRPAPNPVGINREMLRGGSAVPPQAAPQPPLPQSAPYAPPPMQPGATAFPPLQAPAPGFNPAAFVGSPQTGPWNAQNAPQPIPQNIPGFIPGGENGGGGGGMNPLLIVIIVALVGVIAFLVINQK